ncbi:MAG: Ig-like domain-containing protein [Prevotellaceae bacterium]|jgi:uncharacterized protein YjdB|nr:Ig-like domain-containing protein [Prevotellaceae bacterium]
MKKRRILKGIMLLALMCVVAISCQKDEVAVVRVTGITLNKANVLLNIGTTVTVKPTVLPTNATNKRVTWKSDSTNIATVDAHGLITGKAVGTTKITATTVDGNKTATCIVSVTTASIPVTGVTVTPETASIDVNTTVKITAKVSPDNATNKKVTWKSESDAIATVDSTGLVKGIAAGTVKITATTVDGNRTATCTVTVKSSTSVPVTGVTVTPDTANVEVNKTVQITAKVSPDNATNKKVTWKSENDATAIVDSTGLVTGKAVGNVKVIATTDDGGKTDTAVVIVKQASNP